MWDQRELRTAFGRFASGVTVVSCRTDEGEPHGATVSAFTSVSLEPALVQVTLIRGNRVSELVGDRPFAINVLSADQEDVAFHFAGRPKLDEVGWMDGPLVGGVPGAPVLPATVATFSCTPWAQYDGGDHLIVLGEVVDVQHDAGRWPLIFFGGKFSELGHEIARAPWNWSGDDPYAGWYDTSSIPVPPRR